MAVPRLAEAASVAGIPVDGQLAPAQRETTATADAEDPLRGGVGPRPQPVLLRMTRRRTLNGVAYTAISLRFGPEFTDRGVESFRLLGQSPAIQRLNARLAAGESAAAADVQPCIAGVQPGERAFVWQSATPLAITPRLVVWEDGGDSDCGGAHPDEYDEIVVHDLRRGTDIDTWTWFRPSAVGRRPRRTDRRVQAAVARGVAPAVV